MVRRLLAVLALVGFFSSAAMALNQAEGIALMDAEMVKMERAQITTGNDDKLYFYARYTFVKKGKCSGQGAPSVFNFEARAKWSAWNEFSQRPDASIDVAVSEYQGRSQALRGGRGE